MVDRVFTVGELIKDVRFQGIDIADIRKVENRDFQRLIKEGKIIAADDAGSSANLAAYTSLLGRYAVLLTATGSDSWGSELNNYLSKYNIKLVLAKDKSSTSDCALIHLDNNGVPTFVKFILPAIPRIAISDIEEQELSKADIVHVSMMASAFPVARGAVNHAAWLAKKHGKLLSFDANLRCGIYQNHNEMYRELEGLIAKADVIKLSAAEAMFFAKMRGLNSGKRINEGMSLEDLKSVAHEINNILKPKILMITLGSSGAIALSGNNFSWAPSYDYGPVKNTVGAGDAFTAAALSKLSTSNETMSEQEVGELIDFACRIAGISVTGEQTIVDEIKDHGKLEGMPKFADYEQFAAGVSLQLVHEFTNYQTLINS